MTTVHSHAKAETGKSDIIRLDPHDFLRENFVWTQPLKYSDTSANE